MIRTNVAAQRPWGDRVGYSRATRVGQLIEVSGTSNTTPTGTVEHPGDVYAQTRAVLAEIVGAVESLGGTVRDVVRTRIYLVEITDWESVAKAHGEVFHEVLPTSTIVEVSALLLPELLVEIEATAVVEA